MLKAIYRDGRAKEGEGLNELLTRCFDQAHVDHKGIPRCVIDASSGEEVLNEAGVRVRFLLHRPG